MMKTCGTCAEFEKCFPERSAQDQERGAPGGWCPTPAPQPREVAKTCGTCAEFEKCFPTQQDQNQEGVAPYCGHYTPAPQPRQVAEWALECAEGGPVTLLRGLRRHGFSAASDMREELGLGPNEARTFPLLVLEAEPEAVKPWARQTTTCGQSITRLICPGCGSESQSALPGWVSEQPYTMCPRCYVPWSRDLRDLPE